MVRTMQSTEYGMNSIHILSTGYLTVTEWFLKHLFFYTVIQCINIHGLIYFCVWSFSLLLSPTACNNAIFDLALLLDFGSSPYSLRLLQVCRSTSERSCIRRRPSHDWSYRTFHNFTGDKKIMYFQELFLKREFR